MKKQFKLGIIGCSPMACNILKGAVLSDYLHEKKIVVSGVSEKNFEELSYLGVRMADEDTDVAANCEYLLLACGRKYFEENIAGKIIHTKVISIIPNLRKNTVKNAFGVNAVRVARCALNMPCEIGSGVVGIDMSDFNSVTDDIEFISSLFNCVGTVLSVDESKLDGVSALGVDGPAYMLMFIDSLIDAGVKHGLTKNEAKILAVQTMIGTAELVEREEQSVSDLMLRACGKGGTAIEAVKVLEEKDMRNILSEAVTACVKKAKELTL